MSYLLVLGLTVLWTAQIQAVVNRCDTPVMVLHRTSCTSCAAASAIVCPRGSKKVTKTPDSCRYVVEIGGRQVELSGCSHTCQQVTTVQQCCPGFWGPLCLPCPSWSGKICNGFGTCESGLSGNGTCVCEEGYAGFACQNCLNENAYGSHCLSECSCVNGKCNSGPDGDGKCYCQPPYIGPKCDKVSSSCSSCPLYSYCKGDDDTNAVCECLPGNKFGQACLDVCPEGTCGINAKCLSKDDKYNCECKEGFEGDGKHCIPINPCKTNNGDCPVTSTTCELISPGKSKCVCLPGMESSDPSKGCTQKSACTASSCHTSARCETNGDGSPRCRCGSQQIGDGRRCYGNLMERVVELDREGSQAGNLTGSVRFFEQACEFTLSQHGPFTAFIPAGQNPFQTLAGQSSSSILNTVCKNHLILGQKLYSVLEGKDMWMYGGEKIRFKTNKHFILMRDPDVLFTIVESDIPASNGIIHIIDKPFTLTHIESSNNNMEFSTKTISDIFREDDRFNRFLSLVDNCGALLPFRGTGPLTVLVPTNTAIDKFRDGSLMYMLNDAKPKLQTLLKHHIFSLAAITVDQLASMSEITTMANEILRINASDDGRIFLGDKGITLETKDIIASNGIIHLINGVLVPSSIVPIMPHRCDVNSSRISFGSCVRCSHLYETKCPPGSVELPGRHEGCEPLPDRRFSYSIFEEGCAKYCNITETSPQCCRGFYGPDCKPCIGGFQNPCYGKGTCFDGINGNGSCKCEAAFTGVGCHLCSNPKKHGENCDEDCRCVHGVCDNRPGSSGVCRRGSCFEGFLGELCDQTASVCDSDGALLHCHIHAICLYVKGQTTCVCQPGYEGDGYACTESNPCLLPQRGGCDTNAVCSYNAGKVNCVCMEGWTGDGSLCVEINNCQLESRGGCHENADCTSTAPGQNECSCKKGYMGDGIICKIVNPCLSDNGGCHSLAKCKLTSPGTRECTCPSEFEGDGLSCYGNMLVELDGNSEFYYFNRFLQRHKVIETDSQVTALVPSKAAFKNLSDLEESFWFDYYRLPHLLQVHFLEGIYTSEDLRQKAGKTVQTIGMTKWEVQSNGRELMISNATILVPDIKAINGCIHIIDTVLRPPLSDFPPPPPTLMKFLNNTPEFSLFRQAALLYNLENSIPTRDYTILIPYDSAVQEYLIKTNATQLSKEIVKYHVILSEQLFPEHLSDRLFKNTFLGNGTQIMFFVDIENQIIANDVPVNMSYIETRHGIVFGIPRVLDLHKNHCSKDVILKITGRCGDCKAAPQCPFSAKPTQPKFPQNMKSNCKYRTRVGKKRKTVSGCLMDCLRTTKDHSCCPGYFGHDCGKCPGTLDNWCSNNGQCEDGLHGTGKCLCNEGFHGTACEMCEPGRYGKDCKSECHCEHGKCLDGLEGNGQCICFKGWKGVKCSVVVVDDACGGVCDVNANCISGDSGTPPTCSCTAGYKGNGTSCEEINPCAEDNGGCSVNANCTKTAPGERTCTCTTNYIGDGVICVEMDACLVNNGGCDENAICMKTGPNRVACACRPGFISQGHRCLAVNPCRKDNGGCSVNAVCRYLGAGERNCTCYIGFKGDGLQCAGTVSREISRNPEAMWFRNNLGAFRFRDWVGRGPFTVFVPHADYVTNFSNPQVDSWINSSHSSELLRYHIVSCEELHLSDLKSVKEVVTANGYKLRFSVRDGVVYINDNTKIITSDIECSNGILHYIDKVLIPYDITGKAEISTNLNITAAAEQYGFKMFGKLLQDAGLMHVVQHRAFYPFTMFWPTDDVFNNLTEDRKTWLYSEDHRDKLQGYLKAHIVRDERIAAIGLPTEKRLQTLFGSEITFSCNKDLIGDILINGNNARIVNRNMLFDSGIAHGIDQLLEPPSIGARCDDFRSIEIKGRCGSCLSPPLCPYGSTDMNRTSICRQPYRPYRMPNYYGMYSYGYGYRSYRDFLGCDRVCTKLTWDTKCCKNHFGRDCQVCSGGLEAPCGEHGDCDDGQGGTGVCKCHTGFTGKGCELCLANHFGPNCTACNCTIHGKCDEGLDGDGSCFCQEGWMGESCQTAIEVKSICSPACDLNAVCLPENQCECLEPYEGNGINCTAPDLCSEYNGGCHEEADCMQSGINITCSCQTGYSGDGHVCEPINRCVEEANGGCSDFAKCIFTGPNERRCQCLDGYVGNGVQCLEKVVPPVDRCLEDNGGCDPKAICRDLHFHTKTAGVFHLRSPEGKYKMNFTQAKQACEAEGANLATFSQLSDAQQLGMHLCVAGWMDGEKAGYPIRFPSAKCGDNHVGIVVYKDPVNSSWLYDAYCYRMNEVACECGAGYVGSGAFCNGDLASVVATTSNFSVFYTNLLKYAEDGEDGKTLLKALSDKSLNMTIFIPQNNGFGANKTLSWRDLQYHISSVNNIHYYENLKHNTAIPSRLGSKLIITIPSNSSGQTEDAQPQKLVNKKVILAWNIPAINGLIHVIDGPFRAPPVPVPAVLPITQSSGVAVTTVLVVIAIVCIVAGLAYYVLRHKNDAFRFQYFKNDDEDGASTKAGGNALVSIPNPLYSGYRAFAEPFGDSAATDTPNLID
ncbi:stabilin-1 precursor [Danio rerio]|uniref:FEEL-1 n=1 Tax=Danio rerio TaxID=7955 RepID=E0CZJ3_DANRE|nr:stabilin-1 precursor [Danio rerio]BAJ18122.1 FEEL-1 [Danio rerio]|eukprot:NP_001182543.1 stabilin-1 precursor [Danio rerio]